MATRRAAGASNWNWMASSATRGATTSVCLHGRAPRRPGAASVPHLDRRLSGRCEVGHDAAGHAGECGERLARLHDALGGFQWTNRVNVYYQSETENSILTDNGTPTSAFNASRYQQPGTGSRSGPVVDARRRALECDAVRQEPCHEEGVSGGFLETAWGTSPANGSTATMRRC